MVSLEPVTERLHYFEDTLKDHFITHHAMTAFTLDETQSIAFQSISDYQELVFNCGLNTKNI
jgi:hypothetical protein